LDIIKDGERRARKVATNTMIGVRQAMLLG